MGNQMEKARGVSTQPQKDIRMGRQAGKPQLVSPTLGSQAGEPSCTLETRFITKFPDILKNSTVFPGIPLMLCMQLLLGGCLLMNLISLTQPGQLETPHPYIKVARGGQKKLTGMSKSLPQPAENHCKFMLFPVLGTRVPPRIPAVFPTLL